MATRLSSPPPRPSSERVEGEEQLNHEHMRQHPFASHIGKCGACECCGYSWHAVPTAILRFIRRTHTGMGTSPVRLRNCQHTQKEASSPPTATSSMEERTCWMPGETQLCTTVATVYRLTHVLNSSSREARVTPTITGFFTNM